MADKAAFRAVLRQQERALSAAERMASDAVLRERFLSLPELGRAQTVLLFSGMGMEVDTRPLLDTLYGGGKTVLLPCCLPGNGMEARRYVPGRLVRHCYGMMEPEAGCEVVEKAEIDLILVPALCYDRSCFRMGRGGGYYDRYLADFGGYTVGLCRDALLCDAVPREAWDRPVELVLTETQRMEENRRHGPFYD